jgi:micrococcal nuclease
MLPINRDRALRVVVACLASFGLLGLVPTSASAASSSLGPAYRVTGVSDGDTIKVVVRGRTERVRLIGIDTPELGRDGANDQCHARAARAAMERTVRGTRVHLRRDSTQANRDVYGRLLRYVYTTAGRRDVGKALIAAGHGREYTFNKRAYKHRSAHRAAQRAAARARRGLWGSCGSGGSGGGTAAPVPAPGGCVIKGNISDTGERIYHVPGQQYYDRTVVTPAKGERWFCSESDAVAAGWRRSGI